MRASGQPYIVHSVEVARMLAELGLDHHAVAAGLLHDVVEDTDWTVDDLRKHFDDEIAYLVDGVTKLAYIDTMSKMGKRDIEAQ
ncbi:MAG: HD domain-containing protein, partial [Anaerolineae bacterium]|nr:HD domain-containing protein [Anaerolineae bacterium]